jgi:hypothetical protein
MSLAQGSTGRLALMALQTAGTIAATAATGGWGGVAATAFHTAFWAWYDSTHHGPDQVDEQPSIADLKLQTSSLGKVLPQLWGQQRLAGNIIWCTDKVEHQQRTSTSAGKGGGPQQVSITKTYTMSLAIGLADTRVSGPLAGILRAWRDTTLVMDRSQATTGAIGTWTMHTPGSGYHVGDVGFIGGLAGDLGGGNKDAIYQVTSVDSQGGIVHIELINTGSGYQVADDVHLHRNTGSGNHASLNIVSVVGNVLPDNWTFYPGTAAQLPDPTIEGLLGVGNVPGYRYTAYVVMADEELGRSGRTFNYTFELSQCDGGALLVDVVTALTGAAGLSGAVDLTDLPSARVNLVIGQVEALRAPLEHLAQMYRFYVLESGRVLKFRQRGSGDIVAAIAEGDTDAGEHHHGEHGVATQRQHELELPTQLALTYVDPQQNYQQSVQQAQRFLPSTTIENARSLSTGLALDAARAKQTVQELLQDAWLQREPVQTVLPRQYAYLEPGDRLTLTARGLTYSLVLTETAYGQPGLLEVTARTDTAWAVQAPGAAPAVVTFPHPVLVPVGPTTPILLNLPALTASDVTPRYHVAYNGADRPWPGGALYRSLDGGTTYSVQDSATLEGITGTVATAIADADAHVLDTSTVITVVLNDGSLLSVSDVALYNGANVCVLGTEVLAFGVATLVAPHTYELTRLLRGRRGTEDQTGAHGDGETFVLLEVSVHSVAMTLSDRNISRPYKAVTAGQFIADATPVTFTPTAENLNPWTIANPVATHSGSDWMFSWYMRSRFSGEWTSGQGIGFDVDFRGFRVDIFTNGTYATVVRSTLTDGGNPLDAEAVKTFTYSASDQSTDFGSAQSVVYYKVYQLTNNGSSRAAELVAA